MTELRPVCEFPEGVEEGDLVRIIIEENQQVSGHILALDEAYKKTPPKHWRRFVTLSPSYPHREGDTKLYFDLGQDDLVGYEVVRKSSSRNPLTKSGIKTFSGID